MSKVHVLRSDAKGGTEEECAFAVQIGALCMKS